jgi:transcription-repair coupling factor (superfamily II helicase)
MIEEVIGRIQRLVPGAKIAVAHGRVKEIENVILGFGEGGYDVLVATSVIESGLDLPMANTIICVNPQFFGLAALYQLRGRVGRSPRQAYSFFLYPRDVSITVDALRRLQALKELSKLGSGFELANRDMEIRGSGAIVGTEQSGMVDKVGPEVYLALLQEAIEEAKGANVTPVHECALRHVSAAANVVDRGLPPEFDVPGAIDDARAGAMAVRRPRDLLDLRDRWEKELKGPLPQEVQQFLKVQLLLSFGRRLGMAAISTGGKDVVLDVPGWTTTIWDHVRPTLAAALAGVEGDRIQAAYSNSDKQVRLKGLAAGDNPHQLETLTKALGMLFVFVDGKIDLAKAFDL